MIRRALIGLFVGAAGVGAVAVHAGGWAVVTLDALPDTLTAGEPTPISFVVRQHGATPIDGLRPCVEAASGERTLTFDALPAGRAGQYKAALTLPQPGEWQITVHSGFLTSRLKLLPITVIAAGAPRPPAPSPVAQGRRLFVAKGCVACHQNDLGSDNTGVNIGAALIAGKYEPEYLARALANPASVSPRPGAPFRMPNLGLTSSEIASLVAFINFPTVTAATR